MAVAWSAALRPLLGLAARREAGRAAVMENCCGPVAEVMCMGFKTWTAPWQEACGRRERPPHAPNVTHALERASGLSLAELMLLADGIRAWYGR